MEIRGSDRRNGEPLEPSDPDGHEDSHVESPAPLTVPAPGEMPESPEWLLAASLSRLGTAISRALEAGSRQSGLTGTQISALYFARFSRPEFATVGNLARVLGVSHVTIVRSIGPLIEKGYLDRKIGVDRRTTRLVITEFGAEAVEVAFRRRHRVLLDLTSAIPADDADRFAERLIGFAQDLGARVGMRDFGSCARCSFFDDSADQGPAGDSPSPRCSQFDLPMEPEDMILGCPHFAPIITDARPARISNPTPRASR